MTADTAPAEPRWPALPVAPGSALDAAGAIAFGTYQGRTDAIDYAPIGAGRWPRRWRHKRWQYVSIAGPEVVLAVAVVDLGWAASSFAYLFDRTGRRLLADLDVVAPRRHVAVAAASGGAVLTTFRSSKLHVRLVGSGDGRWRLEARSPQLTIDASLSETSAGPTLCAVAPVPGGVVDCTHKTPALHVDGVAAAGGALFDLGSCHGALDHTDGILARATTWRWASATNGTVALNLTEGFTAPYENALWVAGDIRSLGPVHFELDRTQLDAPWRVTSMSAPGAHERDREHEVDLEFLPEGARRKDSALIVASSHYVQPVGRWRGTVAGVRIDELVGVAEDHSARW